MPWGVSGTGKFPSSLGVCQLLALQNPALPALLREELASPLVQAQTEHIVALEALPSTVLGDIGHMTETLARIESQIVQPARVCFTAERQSYGLPQSIPNKSDTDLESWLEEPSIERTDPDRIQWSWVLCRGTQLLRDQYRIRPIKGRVPNMLTLPPYFSRLEGEWPAQLSW